MTSDNKFPSKVENSSPPSVSSPSEPSTAEKNPRRPYETPQTLSEDLLAFGAVCNGMATGGRKATAGAPDFCSAAKLLS